MATDERFDELISTWLQETAPAQIPARVLEEAAQRTRASRQQVGWRGLLRIFHATRSILVLGATAAIMVAAVLALSPRVVQPDVGELPTTPDAWSLVSIDSPWATAQVDALVAGPRGLLAILGETGSHDMQLSVSTDGRTWTLVPNDQFPSPGVLWPPSGSRRLPAVGTTHGFLFIADGNDVWASEDGYSWQRRADRAQDRICARARSSQSPPVAPDSLLSVATTRRGTPRMGPTGRWPRSQRPRPNPSRLRAMRRRRSTCRASSWLATHWSPGGTQQRPTPRTITMVAPVLWTSDDGVSWATVSRRLGHRLVAGRGGRTRRLRRDRWCGSHRRRWNLVLRGQPGLAAGRGRGLPTTSSGSSPELIVSSIAAASSGYVAAGGDGGCAVEPCPGRTGGDLDLTGRPVMVAPAA